MTWDDLIWYDSMLCSVMCIYSVVCHKTKLKRKPFLPSKRRLRQLPEFVILGSPVALHLGVWQDTEP